MFDMFETSKLGLLLALAVETAILIWWSVTRSRKASFFLCIGPLIAVIAILIDVSVQTNREQAETLTLQLNQAAEDEDVAKFINLCSQDMFFEGLMTRDAFENNLQNLFSKPLIQTNRIIELEVIRAEKDRAQVKFRVGTIIDPKSPYRSYTPLVKTAWMLEYDRNAEGKYRLRNANMMELDGGKPVNVFDLVKIH